MARCTDSRPSSGLPCYLSVWTCSHLFPSANVLNNLIPTCSALSTLPVQQDSQRKFSHAASTFILFSSSSQMILLCISASEIPQARIQRCDLCSLRYFLATRTRLPAKEGSQRVRSWVADPFLGVHGGTQSERSSPQEAAYNCVGLREETRKSMKQ